MDVMHQVDAPGGAPENHSSDDYDPWLSDDRDVVVRALDLGPDPAVVLEVARDGSECPARITWASVAFTKLVGLAAPDVVGKRLDSIEETPARAEAWMAFGEVLSGPGEHGSRRRPYHRPTAMRSRWTPGSHPCGSAV